MQNVPERIRHRQTARATLVSAAIEHLSSQGPAGLQPQDICRELGISKALVNYHFGTREGLIAEALVQAYEQHVDELAAAADGDGDAMARLFAWIEQQTVWTTTHSGLAAAIDFPAAALGRSTFDEHLAQRYVAAGDRYRATLLALVRAARTQLQGCAEGDDDDEAVAELIGYLALGASVWIAGRHLCARQTQGDPVLQQMRTTITELLTRT